MARITHQLDVGHNMPPVGFRIEERRGQRVVLLRQATSWITIPDDGAWDELLQAIDAELADASPQLGQLFSSNAIRPSQYGKAQA